MSTDEPQGEGGIHKLLSEAKVIVCCGAGGVGKTTTSATIALQAARMGRRACVVTIDPARRLGDALGLAELSNVPHRIPGPWAGELWALMLDPKSTFDELVTRYSKNPDQAHGILDNRLYRNLSGALSGTQEYMASEKLYELYEEDRFDLIVVDTPPTRNALDFLEAPGRLTRLLENKIFRLLVVPTRAYLRALSAGLRTFLRTMSAVVGTEVVDDAIAFFRAFEGMEEGFRERAERVRALLADSSTAFILVTSPLPESLVEATWFADTLAESGLVVQGMIVNRAHPRFLPKGSVLPDADDLPPHLRPLLENLVELQGAVAAEEDALATLQERVAEGVTAHVPLLAEDVHDLAGLETVASYLIA